MCQHCDPGVREQEIRQLSEWCQQMDRQGIRVIRLTLPRVCRGWYWDWICHPNDHPTTFQGIPVSFW